MIADSTNLTALSDLELDRLIIELIRAPITERTIQSEKLGQAASDEWKHRYPATVSPSFYLYAMELGGFKSCYQGPTETVWLDGFDEPPVKEIDL